MPKKPTKKEEPVVWQDAGFEPGQLVSVGNFSSYTLDLAPPECFDFEDCTQCPGYKRPGAVGSLCNFYGPAVTKGDILTVVDTRQRDETQIVLLLGPDGVLGAIQNEMLFNRLEGDKNEIG
tara:strand:+ start:2741 stop:3103 length:363 start_codon:yes stop_codon:yes gene_type:complete